MNNQVKHFMVPLYVKQNPKWHDISVKNKTEIGKCIQGLSIGQIVTTANNRQEYSMILDISFEFVEETHNGKTRPYCNMVVKRMVTKTGGTITWEQKQFGTIIEEKWLHGKTPPHWGANKTAKYYEVIAEPTNDLT